MLKGDLAATPLSEVLRPLADGAATGCLRLTDPAGQGAKVFLRAGRVYAVAAPGEVRDLGDRLVERGSLAPEALEAARDAQDEELSGWRLSELLVHLGYVEQDVVEAAVLESVREALADLLPWGVGSWRFRVNERTRDDVVAPTPWDELLAGVTSRTPWSALTEVVLGAEAVVSLSAAGTSSSHLSIGAAAWDVLCKVDGERTLTGLARECGLPLYEAGVLVRSLVDDGLLEVAAPEPAAADAEPAASFVPAGVASRLAQALAGRSFSYDMDDARADGPRSLTGAPDEQLVNGSISRVSQSLSALLGPGTANDDVFSAPVQRSRRGAEPTEMPLTEEQRRDGARRRRDAADLVDAQAQLESARRAARESAERLEADRAAAARAEAARAEAERAEAERVEAERAAAERVDTSSDELFLELSSLSSDDEGIPGVTGAQHAEVMAELRASSTQPTPGQAEPQGADAGPALAAAEPEPERARMVANRDADTASLLRELSSLGLDDEPAPAPTRPVRPPAPRQPPAAAARKRKGIFGR